MGSYQGRYQHQRFFSANRWKHGVAKAGTTCVITGLLIGAGYTPTPGGMLSCLGAAYGESLSDSKTIDLELADADLQTVVGLLQRKSGAEIVVQSGDHPFGRINVNLRHASLEKALRNIALSANASVTRNEDGVYVLRPASATADAAPSGATQQLATYAPNAAASNTRRETADMHWYKLPLQYAVPKDVLYLTGWVDNPRELRPFDHTRANNNNSQPERSPSLFTLDGHEAGVPSAMAGNGSIGPESAQRSASGDPGSQANQFPGGGGGFGGGGGGGFGGGGGGGFGGGGRQGGGGGFGGGGLGGGAGGQNANLPEGVNQIIALQADNSLLIQATPEAYLRLKEIVKNIDVLPRQVQIKVEFITASVNDIDQFGINFSLVPYPGVSGSSTLINTSVPTYSVGVISGNLVAQIQGALSKGRGKVIQSPTITTTNNTEARIEVQRQIPYTTSQTIIPNSGNTITTTTPQFLTLSTNLDVTPRINNDDTVTLFLTPQIETPGDIPTNGGPPATTRQRIQTLRTIRSGDTMVLGGLITDTESYSQSRIPILSDLPIIGNLFRNRGKNVSNAELLIFVTPTILDANGYATVTGGNSAAISGSVTP